MGASPGFLRNPSPLQPQPYSGTPPGVGGVPQQGISGSGQINPASLAPRPISGGGLPPSVPMGMPPAPNPSVPRMPVQAAPMMPGGGGLPSTPPQSSQYAQPGLGAALNRYITQVR
jgi:hypothetical protein